MGLIIIYFVQTSKLAYKYRLHLWIYVRDSPPGLSGEPTLLGQGWKKDARGKADRD